MTAEIAARPAPAARSGAVLAWGGGLLLVLNFAGPAGGFISVPVSFFLKNRLHLSANQLAVFNLWTGAPLYLAVAFGFLRDRWSPLRLGDRGHLMIFGAATAAIYALFALLSPTYAVLFAGMLAATAALQAVQSAANGLVSGFGQDHALAGRASAVMNFASCAPAVAAYLLGGILSSALEGNGAAAAARAIFLAGGALMALAAVMGALGPRRLYAEESPHPKGPALGDIARLFRSWPVWPPLMMLLLWDFAPASGAVLQYHLANSLHASDAQVGAFYAIFYAFCLPPIGLYALLCRRVRLSRLLLVSTLIAIPQWTPLLFVRSATGALLAAIPIGLMGGMASAAYLDLAIRSTPKGLQGTVMMLAVTTVFYVAVRFGDLWGTALYETRGGFAATVLATSIVYGLILAVLPLAPRRLTATSDGEALAPA